MKKRISAFLLACLMLVMTFATAMGDMTTAKAEELVLKFHYHRADGDYKSWDVWLWEVGGDGSAFTFDEVDDKGNGVATKVVTPGTSSIGYIVRTAGSWDAKDVAEDQFIDISQVTSGTVHFYVESQVAGGTIEMGDDVQAGVKITSAKYNDTKKAIVVIASDKIEDVNSKIKVKYAGKDAAISSITEDGTTYYIALEDGVDMMGTYHVAFDGVDYLVTIPSIFSTDAFEAEYTYTGNDLGATWTKDATSFRVWAPTASAVKVNLYASGDKNASDLKESVEMTKDVNGTWVATVSGDLHKTYYTYSVTLGDNTVEACDPYAKAVGINGNRAMVIDLESTNPEGWENDKNPNADLKITDAVIYELHVRDLGSKGSANITNRGKFLSLTEHGTKTNSGISTGIDHIKELGITHLHFLPIYDFGSVDEAQGGYNWGYDPKNYNVPEGSYSTDPANGEVRISEMKQMVQSIHNDGISVVMDVVYNHVHEKDSFSFNVIVPQYFSRLDANGNSSNGSGCGNDTASERSMVRKYIVDSVLYWATEYHIDGFRFDLAGLIDIDTINEIIEEVHAVRPDVIFYGEGWTMQTGVTKQGVVLTTQMNSTKVPGFAFFNDNIRNDIEGHHDSIRDKGFISGKVENATGIAKSWLGNAGVWCKTPSQSVNYASSHDNYTLFDRISAVAISESMEKKVQMNNFAAATYLTAQGIPFMQAGEEMLRQKLDATGAPVGNSYNSGDFVNGLNWDALDDANYMNAFNYYKGLIAFRRAHAGLRLATPEEVDQYVKEIEGMKDAKVVAYEISGDATGEESDGIIVVMNPNAEDVEVALPEGKWGVCVNATKAGTDAFEVVEGKAVVSGVSAMVLVKNPKDVVTDKTDTDATANPIAKSNTMVVVAIAVAVVLVLAVVAVVVVMIAKKRKNK